MADSQAPTVLGDSFYDDPSQLSQALAQRAGSEQLFHFTTSTESYPSGNAPAAFVVPPPRAAPSQQRPIVPDSLARAPAPRRVSPTKHVKPALPKHCSAPTSTGMVVQLHATLKMHHTFNGMDAPGDTQPDSQIYKEWTSGIFQSAEVNTNNHQRYLRLQSEGPDDGDDDDLPSDELENDDSSQRRNDTTITSPTVVGFDDQAPLEQDSLAPTSPLKFETPALAGRIRHHSAHALSSAARTNTTPGTVASASAFGAAFGNAGIAGGPLMSLTQIWQNTQAPTSPAVDGVNEDAVFSRPSPNFTNARHSSPIPAYSSPIKAIRPETPRSDPVLRSSSEPRAEYVTMEQSQEKRKLSTGEAPSGAAEQDSWAEWGELSRKVKAKRAREQFDRRTARTLSHVSAPTPASPQARKQRAVNAKQSSPVRSKALRGMAYKDLQDEDDSMDEPLQHMPVKDPDEEEEEEEEEDSLDELSQNVPSSTRTTVNRNTNENRILVPKTSSHPHRTPSAQTSRAASHQPTPSSQLQRESRPRGPASQSLFRDALVPRSSRDSVAVMDSQPDFTVDLDSVPRPKALRFPSSPSTNQYSINQTTMATKTGYTSQVISSSMPPLPPGSSSEDGKEDEDISPAEEERVPSSPPLLPPEDGSTRGEDLEYNEHAYDEYAEGDDQEAMEPLATEEDVNMEEDLPIAKLEPVDGEDERPQRSDTPENSDLDLIQPQKVDLGTDQEVPETLDHDGSEDDAGDYEIGEDERQNAAKWHAEAPRMQRQNTVPETDALDETQPTFFPEHSRSAVSGDDLGVPDDTNSTEPFQTAQEEASVSQTNITTVPVSSKEDESDVMQVGDRIQSISDIHNLPQTQQSQVEEEIEMPQLSGFGEDETAASPGPPPAKKRKVTYAAKGKTFRSPIKPTSDSESLSDPPASLPQEDAPTTSSTQEWEDSGALAATHARASAETAYTRRPTRKSTARPRASKPQPQKAGTLKPVPRALLQTLSSPATSPFKSKGSRAERASTPVTPTRPRTDGQTDIDVDMPDDHDDEADELGGSTPRPVDQGEFFEISSKPGGTPPEDILVPNRVFAAWPGGHYYPATCIGRSNVRQLKVRYDDGNETYLESVQVRALDLRTGDHVKVDEPGMKKHTYIVVGFKDKIDDLGGEEFPTTDRRGFATIVLEEKRRDSLGPSKKAPPAERISVPMIKVYLTTQIWTRLRDRSFNFTPPESPIKIASRVGTPVAEPLAALSFTRRGPAAPSLLRDMTTRAGSVASSAKSGAGVFSNMAFVLTSTAKDVDKETIAKVIKTNGGQVLEQGFHELFELDTPDLPSSQSRRRSTSVGESVGLALKLAYSDLGFVALISDSHSRSTKYIQALALNVPCLHLRWVDDSLLASRALHFSKYLLPAGVSKFLDPNGIVRSRTMQVYDPAGDDVSFAQMIQDRDLLLHDQSVLLVTGKSKKEIEKRQPFIFLTHALGSANVGRCVDLDAASQMLHEAQWDWVYVDNGEKGVADAAAELFGTEKPTAGNKGKKSKKRKRDESEEKEELVARGDIAGRKVRITCSEFVIQSLILGALVEE